MRNLNQINQSGYADKRVRQAVVSNDKPRRVAERLRTEQRRAGRISYGHSDGPLRRLVARSAYVAFLAEP